MANKIYSKVKKWRKENPKKRNAQRKRYYHKLRPSAARSARPWKNWHMQLIIEHRWPDRVLAKLLNRSVAAIQQKRYTLQRNSHGS